MNPEKVGNIGMPRKGLPPVGVTVDLQLADDLLGRLVGVVDHQVAAEKQVVEAHLILLASGA